MQRSTIRRVARVLAASALGLALLLPTAALAADPSSDPNASGSASAQPSDTAPGQPAADPSDGTVQLDPTFITTPTATPAGAVLSATGKPNRTPPATDTVGQRPTSSAPQGLLVLLAVLATICLACARTPDVRRR